jgi:nitrite reductase (NO-forming)
MLSKTIDTLATSGQSRMNRRSLLKRAGIIGLTLPAAGAILNACGDESPNSSGLTFTPATPAMDATSPSAASAEPTEITITAMDLKFEPANVSAPVGAPVRLIFENKGAIEHDWDIHGVKASGLKVLEKPASFNQRMADLLTQAEAKGQPYAGAAANERMVIEFTPTEAGTFEMGCMVPGHLQAGMKGTFTVTGGQASAAPASSGGHSDPHAVSAPAQASGTAYDAPRLPMPVVAPPVGNRAPMTIKETIEIREIVGYVDEGVAYEFWTFDGTIPGKMLRVRVGDTVELTLKNPAESKATHNIDLHAVTGPGGGGHVTMVAPGESKTFRFKALNPGVYVYHCAVAPIPHHISSGMYGLIVVEPEGGLPKVDREFYVMQGDLYLEGKRGEKGLRPFSMDKMLDERPDYVIFNGSVGAITEERAFEANVGETLRIFFGVGGPNLVSSFHVIGEIFDRVMPEGASEWVTNVQTTLVPAGGATIVDFKVEVPGTLIMVDHSLGRAGKGGIGMINVTGPENPDVFQVIEG